MRILFIVNSLGLMDSAGIAYLSAVARDLGHERFLCILREQDITKRIVEVNPNVLAYSFNSCEAGDVFRAHAKAKAASLFSGIFSIMGGPHPTLYPESLAESGADAYCVGEGEGAFADVLVALKNGDSVERIPNIHTRDRKNEVRALADLAALPLPDRDLMLGVKRMSQYPRKMFLTSRGCPESCTYCFNSSLKRIYAGRGKWVRRFPVDRVIRQIQDVRAKHALNFVKFDDDNFAFRRDDWLEEFAERYHREIRLPFNCLIRLDCATEPLLALLERAGCYSITTSVDSANQQIRETILRRGHSSNADLIDAMRRIRGHHINLFVNYITGVPTATEKDELGTFHMNRDGKVTYANYTALVPFKGTELWDYCNSKGLYDDTAIPKSLLKPSRLLGFTHSQRKAQRNVLLLGAYSCLVHPRVIVELARLPSGWLFKLMYSLLKSRRISTKIYRPHAGLLQQFVITVRATISDFKEL